MSYMHPHIWQIWQVQGNWKVNTFWCDPAHPFCNLFSIKAMPHKASYEGLYMNFITTQCPQLISRRDCRSTVCDSTGQRVTASNNATTASHGRLLLNSLDSMWIQCGFNVVPISIDATLTHTIEWSPNNVRPEPIHQTLIRILAEL